MAEGGHHGGDHGTSGTSDTSGSHGEHGRQSESNAQNDRGDQAHGLTAGMHDAIGRAAAEAHAPRSFEAKQREAARDFTSQRPGPENHVPKKNADCGPTSLVTALKAEGKLSVDGVPGRQINHVREQMTMADDHQQPTNVKQITAAAKLDGVNTTPVNGLKAINKALKMGQVVVEGGEPTNVKNGVSFNGVTNAPPAKVGHFVTVIDRNPITHNYTVDNPESTTGPQTKTPKQMAAFIGDLSGLHTGVAISAGPANHSEHTDHTGHTDSTNGHKAKSVEAAPAPAANANAVSRSAPDSGYLLFPNL